MAEFNPTAYLNALNSLKKDPHEKEVEVNADPTLEKIKQAESHGLNIPNATGSSSAFGQYQIVKPTFESLKKNDPELSDITWDQFKANPNIQEQFATKLKNINAETLAKHNLEDNAANHYAMWFTGNTRLLTADPNAPISTALTKAQIQANKLAGKTVGEVRTWLANKVGEDDAGQTIKFDPAAYLASIQHHQQQQEPVKFDPAAYLASLQQQQAEDENGWIPTKRQMKEEGFAGRILATPENLAATKKAFDIMQHPFSPDSAEKLKELQAHPYTPKDIHVQMPSAQEALQTVKNIPSDVGTIVSSAVHHPLDTAKAMSRGIIEDPELLHPALWETIPEKMAAAVAKAGLTGKLAQGITKVAGHGVSGAAVGAGAETAAEAAEGTINPQKVLEEAKNFAVMGGGMGALGELYKGVRGERKAPEMPLPETPPEAPTGGAGPAINEEHLFDAEDLGVQPAPTPAPARPVAQPAQIAAPVEAPKEPIHVSDARKFLDIVDSGIPPHQGVANSILEQFGLETRPEQPNATVNRLRQAVKRHDALGEEALTNPPALWQMPEQPVAKPTVPDISQQIENAARGENPAGPVEAPVAPVVPTAKVGEPFKVGDATFVKNEQGGFERVEAPEVPTVPEVPAAPEVKPVEIEKVDTRTPEVKRENDIINGMTNATYNADVSGSKNPVYGTLKDNGIVEIIDGKLYLTDKGQSFKKDIHETKPNIDEFGKPTYNYNSIIDKYIKPEEVTPLPKFKENPELSGNYPVENRIPQETMDKLSELYAKYKAFDKMDYLARTDPNFENPYKSRGAIRAQQTNAYNNYSKNLWKASREAYPEYFTEGGSDYTGITRHVEGLATNPAYIKAFAEKHGIEAPTAEPELTQAEINKQRQAEQRSANAKKMQAQQRIVDPANDDMITAIARMGGLNIKEAASEFGLDPADMKNKGIGFRRAFHAGESAKSLDTMREALAQYGYISPESTVSEFGDKLHDALSGERVMAPEGQEKEMRLRYEGDVAAQEAEHNALELTGQTEAEIKSAEEAKKQAAAEERVKENAPAAEEFALTGSNRPADVAAAHGAQDMFGAKPKEEVSPINVGDNTEYRITKNEDGWAASLVDIDSNKAVDTRVWPFETFGEKGKQKAIEYANSQAEKAQSYGKKPEAEAPKEVNKNDVGNMVKIEKPGTQDVIAGTITRKLPDGRIEVRTQNDGYHYVDRMEIIEDVTYSKSHPEDHAEVDDQAAYDARQAKAEAHIDEGPIGQAIQRIDNGDFETKAQIKRFVQKLEKEGIIEDPYDIYESLSDREQYADDIIYEVRDALESAKDDAVQEYADELERDEELAKESAKEGKPAEEDRWSDPDYIPFNIEKKGAPKPEDIPGHDNPYPATEEQAQRAPSLRVVANKLRRMHEQGKITSEEFYKGIKEILDFTKKDGTHQERVRGAEILKEKLQKALRKGELSKEAVRLAEWFINKNPQLVDDLGISIRAPKEHEVASGLYNSMARIMVLLKGSEGELTPIHEILHHLERMMPEPIRRAIRKAWADSFIEAKKAADKGDDEILKKYYDDLVKYHLEGDKEAGESVRKALSDGDVDIEHYQHYNASEFWAVNGSDIMGKRFAAINNGIVNRLGNWLREFGEKVKSFFGFKSDAPILNALDSLQKGDGKFVTNFMLAAEEEYRNFDRKKAKDLQKEFDDLGIPQARHHGEDTLKEKFVTGIGHLKDILKGLAEPKKSVNKMISGLDDSLTNFQTGFIYGGIGLEKAEARLFGNKLFKEVRDAADKVHKVAIASVAQMNALHSGHIASEVMMLGKLVFDPASQMFKAVKDKFSMRNVFKLEQSIYKKLGKDAGSTLMQSYFEAKRARSIQNEFLDRQAEYERQIAAGEDADKALQDLKNIEFIFRDKIPSYFLVKDANGQVIRDRKGFAIINDEAIDRMIAKERQYPELRQMMDNWTAVNHNMLDNLVFGGVMSKTRGEHLKSIKDYVPWTRITDDMDELHAPSGAVSSLTNVPKEKKFARGVTEKQINNIISNMVNNVMMMTRNAARNHAALKIAAQFGTKKENGKLAVFPRQGMMPDGALRTNILINGKRVIIEIKDPHVAQAMIGMESMELPMMEFLGKMQQFGRRGVTINPFFQLYQVVKDAPTAAAVTGLKNPVLAATKVLGSFLMALNPGDSIVKTLKSYGVGGFQLAGRTAEKDFALAMKVQNHNLWSFLLKALDHIGDASDYAQRRIIYKEVLKRSGSETEAIFAANSVIDFMRHGNNKWAQAEVRTVAFMGAFANQIDVLGDAMTGRRLAGMSKGKAAAQFYKATAAFTTLAMIYTMMKMNDPEYQKLDDQTKARNWIIGGMKIPMSTSYSFFFKAIPELALNYIVNKGTENEMDATRLRHAITTAAADSLLGPNPIPAGFKTPIEIITNHDFFTGGTVVPRGLEGLESFEQFNANTSQLGKAISASTLGALNPIQADHLVKGWFATVGALTMWASDMFTSDKPEKVWSQNPLVGQMFLSPTPHGPEERFYDLKERSDKAYKTWTTLQSREREAEAENYFNKNQAVLQLHDYVTGSDQKLKEINGEMARIADVPATEMSAAEKKEQLIYYKNLKNEILEDVNQYRLMAERGEDITAQ